MIEKEISKDSYVYLVSFLKESKFFKDFSTDEIKQLLSRMRHVSIRGGDELIKEGSSDFSAYVLIYGRLRLFIKSDSFSSGYYTRDFIGGEVVGEISLLASLARTGTVVAIRDSTLLKINKEDFDVFKKENFEAAYKFITYSLCRLADKEKVKFPGEKSKVITIIPAGNSDHIKFSNHFCSALKEKYRVAIIHSSVADELIKKIGSIINNDQYIWSEFIESKFDYVIYIADNKFTSRTEKCIRESDHVLLIADSRKDHQLNETEKTFYFNMNKLHQTADIIFVHHESEEKITGTMRWLKERPVRDFFHVKEGNSDGIKQIIRLISGNGFGLVLNGGGARGYAHLGVLRAMDELKIPIDYIGGTSIGAIFGAGARSVGLMKMYDFCNEFSKNYRGDFTFPYLSIFKGERVENFFKKWSKDLCIEDIWTRFFCVSCNLTKGKKKLHETGLVWEALRATSSMPVIFPPLYLNSDAYIDGGVIDNMPTLEMKKKIRGGKVIAVDCNKKMDKSKITFEGCGEKSGWKLLINNLFNRGKEPYSDNIVNILLSTVGLVSIDNEKEAVKYADYLLEIDTTGYNTFDFHRFEEIERRGYEEAMNYFSTIDFGSL